MKVRFKSAPGNGTRMDFSILKPLPLTKTLFPPSSLAEFFSKTIFNSTFFFIFKGILARYKTDVRLEEMLPKSIKENEICKITENQKELFIEQSIKEGELAEGLSLNSV